MSSYEKTRGDAIDKAMAKQNRVKLKNGGFIAKGCGAVSEGKRKVTTISWGYKMAKKSKNNSIMKKSKGGTMMKKSKGGTMMKKSKGGSMMYKSKGGSVIAGNANRRRENNK